MLVKIHRLLRRTNGEQGFTLVELMLVVAVIGILLGVGIPSYRNARAKAQEAQLRATAANVETALELYMVDNNQYPDSIKKLVGSYIQIEDASILYDLDEDQVPDNFTGIAYKPQPDGDYTIKIYINGKAINQQTGDNSQNGNDQ